MDLRPTKAAARVGETVSLGPPGVYDPELQLSDDELVGLKEILRDDPFLCAKISTHIALHLVKELEKPKEGILQRGGNFVRRVFDARYTEDFARRVGMFSTKWFMDLRHYASLPGAEWPEHTTPPATFAVALNEVRAMEEANG